MLTGASSQGNHPWLKARSKRSAIGRVDNNRSYGVEAMSGRFGGHCLG